ncbi:hypothetical protein RIF29_20417 [Crotalaria pallida]|uniref:Uncharacterized protein n=1 Tax=Crotalaria pallida TaxID=3830 RepID=A0AAN9F9M9_CROPI
MTRFSLQLIYLVPIGNNMTSILLAALYFGSILFYIVMFQARSVLRIFYSLNSSIVGFAVDSGGFENLPCAVAIMLLVAGGGGVGCID